MSESHLCKLLIEVKLNFNVILNMKYIPFPVPVTLRETALVTTNHRQSLNFVTLLSDLKSLHLRYITAGCQIILLSEKNPKLWNLKDF